MNEKSGPQSKSRSATEGVASLTDLKSHKITQTRELGFSRLREKIMEEQKEINRERDEGPTLS